MKNYKITPFEYKKTKLCPICNSKLKIEYFKDIDDGVKNKKKICEGKGHYYLLNNEYGDSYNLFFLERVSLNKALINYEYDFIYYHNGGMYFTYNIPTDPNLSTARTKFNLTRKKKLAYKIREAILNQNENLLKKIMLLL